MPTALVTGASRGLGRALTRALVERGWTLIVDARGDDDLRAMAGELAGVEVVPGDVTDPRHQQELVAMVRWHGGLDLLANNASALGPSPQPSLESYPLDELERVYRANVFAPLALTQLVLPLLRQRNGTIVNVTSDAAVEPYAGWGGYGSSKAALDQLTNILAAEQPTLAVYAFDPGDMRTNMHQAAFPGEDISDRPEPETVVPAFLRLLDDRPASGRYRATDLLAATAVSA
jgi:NAD(P)-dependent dehydrogenase (short-subunit alcohol dehydrogenase family)